MLSTLVTVFALSTVRKKIYQFAAQNARTMMSMVSCRFLQVDLRVSDVPHSKYQSLFFILRYKQITKWAWLAVVRRT